MGVVLSVVMLMLEVSVGTAIQRSTYDQLLWIFRIFPIYALTKGILKLYKTGSFIPVCKNIPEIALNSRCPHIDSNDQLFGCCTGNRLIFLSIN